MAQSLLHKFHPISATSFAHLCGIRHKQMAQHQRVAPSTFTGADSVIFSDFVCSKYRCPRHLLSGPEKCFLCLVLSHRCIIYQMNHNILYSIFAPPNFRLRRGAGAMGARCSCLEGQVRVAICLRPKQKLACHLWISGGNNWDIPSMDIYISDI